VIQPHEQEAEPGKDDDQPYQIEKDPLEKWIAVRLIADDENIGGQARTIQAPPPASDKVAAS
jgi:hypothetical protein